MLFAVAEGIDPDKVVPKRLQQIFERYQLSTPPENK
jgi:hypothetical protein